MESDAEAKINEIKRKEKRKGVEKNSEGVVNLRINLRVFEAFQ